MPCTISYVETNENCQFKVSESKLIEFDHKRWCIFHLPIENAKGGKSQKANWTSVERDKFLETLSQTETRQPYKNFNARYVIFPDSIDEMKVALKIPASTGDFSHAVFYGDVNFASLLDVDFSNVTFKGKAKFTDFQGFTSFKRASFYKLAGFGPYKVYFSATSFEETIFYDKTDFSGAKFSKQADSLENPPDKSSINFRKVKFNQVRFNQCEFEAKTDFTNCTFQSAPEFNDCEHYQNIIFPKQSFFKDTHSEGAARAYRTLNLKMADLKARREEAMFYALEQKSLRRKLGTWDKIISYTYDITSGYGQSINRVVLTLVAITMTFFMVYLSLTYRSSLLNQLCLVQTIISRWLWIKQATIPILNFIIQQTVRPFGLWSDPSSAQALVGQNINAIRIWATLQSISMFIMLTLLVFIIRWKFKRE